MSITVTDASLFVENLHARTPFAFGSVTIHALPHVFVRVEADIDGTTAVGVTADHAVPKWFVKDAQSSVADDVRDILAVIEHACDRATSTDAPSVFDVWQELHDSQSRWAARAGHPPLLASFGVSFVERALIDAFCRANRTTVAAAVRSNALGIRPGDIYDQLSGVDVATALPDHPSQSVAVRHTVGLADPLTDSDVVDPTDDGLPESLEQYIDTDGVRYVKCKLGGDAASDADRLERVAGVLDDRLADYGVTLDANEQYGSIAALDDLWDELRTRPALERFARHTICIEQPFDRSFALDEEVGAMLDRWEGPPIIVDESDSDPDSLAVALDRGYAGASYKSCKGVLKGVVNACLLPRRREETPNRTVLHTAEDLTTVGPVSLLQDLAVVGMLGIDHAERNGHHYFRGLDAFPDDIQTRMTEAHGDLYRSHGEGYATLDIDDGRLALNSVVDAPYGVEPLVDPSRFTPREEWRVETLGLEE
jgi:L-alanine-DL-glutamate epimerase-like enolase superfamily enzyme